MPSKEIWSQDEERLASLKICQTNEELQCERKKNRDDIFRRNNGNLNYLAIISQTSKLVINEAGKCADVVYEKFCEVRQKHGKTKTPEFLRSVILPRVWEAIDAHVSIGRDELERIALRLSIHDPIMKPHLSDLHRKAEYLKRDKWQRKIEIEAREIELYNQSPKAQTDNAVVPIQNREPKGYDFESNKTEENSKVKRPGRQDRNVQARRTEIRNAIIDGITSREDFCKRLGSPPATPVPERWPNKYNVSTWQEADISARKPANRLLRIALDKLLADDRAKIFAKDPTLRDRWLNAKNP